MPILTDAERCGTELAGKYRIESILGRGGMGVVFRARHVHTRRAVAIKILRPELSQDPTLGKRFIREARAASALTHPNVVEVLDVGIEPDGTIYQVLELLEGTSLRDYLDERVRLAPERTLAILLPVMDALVRAHELGIVHRDLKPDNIFLARGEGGRTTPTLLDFGIAKVEDGGGSVATRTGGVMGTPSYMAPEQARGAKDQGAAIDVWAIGVIAYECIAGAVPFVGDSPAHVMVRIMTEPVPRLDAVAEVPEAIADAVAGALRKEPAARHASMQTFIDALRAAAQSSGIALPAARESTLGPLSMRPPATPTEGEAIDVHVSTSDREAIGEVAAQLRAQRRHDSAAMTSAGVGNAQTEAATPSAIAAAAPPTRARSMGLALGAVALVISAAVVWAATRPTEPATTVPSTTVPSTTVPSTTVPSTTVPATTVPATTVPADPPPSTTVPADPPPSTTIPIALDPPPTSAARPHRPHAHVDPPAATGAPPPPPPSTTTAPERHGLPGVTGEW